MGSDLGEMVKIQLFWLRIKRDTSEVHAYGERLCDREIRGSGILLHLIKKGKIINIGLN